LLQQRPFNDCSSSIAQIFAASVLESALLVIGRRKKMLITHVAQRCRPLIRALVLLQFVGCLALASNANRAVAQIRTAKPTGSEPAPNFVAGFVGGHVHNNDLRHSEVQLAQRLQARYGDNVEVRVFRNRDRASANKAIVDWLNGLKIRAEQTQQKLHPRIILFGHSWGGSAVVYLARKLEQEDIPVALTVQVDSVRKRGEDDSVIPANVSEAVNFYQTKGIIHGQSRIRAADPAYTVVLGNLRFQYKIEPSECRTYPWYDRLLFKGHTSIECDPRVWSRVQTLIESQLVPATQLQPTEVAAQREK
jgi:hypothetical protein